MRWLAFDSNREGPSRDIYMLRGDGSERTRLTQGPGEERESAFSPDGTRLAYVSERDGAAVIFVYDFESGEARRVSRWPELLGRSDWFASGPAWFPDGTKLAFQRGGAMLVIDAHRGGDEQTLALGEEYVDGYQNAIVTQDGRELICDRLHEIVAVDVRTRALRQIVPKRPVRIEAPSLSPDGTQIAYSVVCDDSFLQTFIGLRGVSRLPQREGRAPGNAAVLPDVNIVLGI
jgi:TolB protein